MREPLRPCFLHCIALALAAALAAASPATAQANLEVEVVHAGSGDPASGIEVQVENATTGYDVRLRTGELGRVRFPAVPTGGPYTVTAHGGDALATRQATGIVLRANFDRSVRLALEPLASFSEAVTVTAESQTVAPNAVNAEVSATLAAVEIEAVPVEGRDLTRALFRLPNVTQATGFYPEAPNVSINGANGLYTAYLMDGLDNNENFLGGQKFAVPTGFVQDVTVLTGSFSAEFGRTGNGIFNVTTKSGSSTYHGEAFYLSRPGASVDASSPYAGRDLTGNQVKDGFRRDQLGAAIGGPLAGDATFFFANVEATHDRKDNLLTSPRIGVSDTVPGENTFLYVSGRVDHRFTDSLVAAVRANVGDVAVERQGGGLDGGTQFPEAGSTQDRSSVLTAASLDAISGSLYNRASVSFTRFRWNYVRAGETGRPSATALGADGSTVAVLGHPGWTFDDLEETFHVQDKVDLLLGDHTVKLGAEAITSSFSLLGGGNPAGNYLVQLDAADEAYLAALGRGAHLSIYDLPADVPVLRYDVELKRSAIEHRQTIWSAWAEDQWAVSPRFTIGLGVRWDVDTLSEGGGDGYDTNNVAPRLSLNYRLDDRSVLRAGAGLFYDKVLYAIYSDALQQSSTAAGYRSQLAELVALGLLPAGTDLDRVLHDGNLSASFTGVTFLDGPTPEEVQGSREDVISNELRLLNPDGYDNPVTTHLTLGYQRQLAQDVLLSVDLIQTRGSGLPRLANLNAPAPYPLTDPDSVVVRTPAEADATRPVALVDGGARNIVMTEMEGDARYRAATVTLQTARGARLWAGRLSYTLSQLENDTDDINFRAQDANGFDAEWGPSVNDRRHVISALVQVFPLPRLSCTLAALVQSGQPINRIPDAAIWGTTDLNGDGRSFGDAYVGNSDRWPGAARNSDRLPWSSVFDLGVAYRLPLLGDEIELRADVFNLFNHVNLSGYANNATQSNQIQTGPEGAELVERNAGPPRQIQLGVRYVF
jgi:outer membrane receptor for ferrienterochelin and colicin